MDHWVSGSFSVLGRGQLHFRTAHSMPQILETPFPAKQQNKGHLACAMNAIWKEPLKCEQINPFTPREWSISNFPCSLTRNTTSPSMKNLVFHIAYSEERLYYQFSPPHTYISLFKGRKNVVFELGSERG